jgi:hypothetical protein
MTGYFPTFTDPTVLVYRLDQANEDLVNDKGYQINLMRSPHGHPLISCTIYIVIKP